MQAYDDGFENLAKNKTSLALWERIEREHSIAAESTARISSGDSRTSEYSKSAEASIGTLTTACSPDKTISSSEKRSILASKACLSLGANSAITARGDFSSLNLDNKANASLRDVSMFLSLIEWFGLNIATHLASELHIPIVSSISLSVHT